MDKGKIGGNLKWSRIGLGAIAGLLSTILATMVLALLINKEVLGQTSVKMGAGIILFVSAAIAALVSMGKGSNKLPVAVITGTLYCLCLLCINALFYSGEYAGVPVSVLLAMCAAAGAGIVSSGKKNKGKYKRKRH